MMLRWYIIIVVVAVAAASLVSRAPSAADASHLEIVAGSADAEPARAALDAGSSLDPLDRGIELKRDASGYFYANVQINGAQLHMLVDTGASIIALSRNDAQLAGIATDIGMNEVVGEGADGPVRGQEVRLDRVTMGDRTVEGLPAVVLNSGNQSLLGQSFLSKFSSVKIEGDRMILR